VRKEGRPGRSDPLVEDVPPQRIDGGEPLHSSPTVGDPVPPSRYVVLGDSRGRARPAVAAVDPGFQATWPAIWEYLTCLLIGDKGREAATLIVCAEEGQVKLCLSDRETNRVLWRTAETFQGAMDALERALEAGAKDWRERKEYKRK